MSSSQQNIDITFIPNFVNGIFSKNSGVIFGILFLEIPTW